MNEVYIMIVPNHTPFRIALYGSHKMVISQDERAVKISDTTGFVITKGSLLSQVSHCFNLPYIRKKDKAVQLYKLIDGALYKVKEGCMI